MKYRFRRSEKKASPRLIKKGTAFRLAGRSTLKPTRPLPEPIEGINFSENESFTKRKKSRDFLGAIKKFISSIFAFFEEIGKELSAAGRRLYRFFGNQRKRLSDFSARRRASKKEKKIDSLPILLGAATASFLVCVITASYVAVSLFAPYARNYTAVTIPALQGKRLEDVDLGGESFNLIIQYENNPDVENGRIISQAPAAGVTRKIYERGGFCDIRVTVSRQLDPTVPDGIVGASLRDAALSLLNRGLSYTVEEKFSDIKKGTVLSVYPTEGESLRAGSGVTLTVSAGRQEDRTDVPSLSGLSESEAIFRIKKSGLTLGEVTYVRSDRPAGTVISQSPSAHLSVSSGERISFTVSAGEDFSAPTVPDLYGLSVEEAKKKLLSVGLTVSSVYSVSSAAKSGTVIYQSPIAGTPITAPITSVELHISN